MDEVLKVDFIYLGGEFDAIFKRNFINYGKMITGHLYIISVQLFT